ncbi:MAG TPA: peptide deformylase [Deltaproteobacteria bacterium]|jgi:peptide deformylase|nr:peptide deformylase [Deltaproteobacteria bacterium]HQJ07788.1 peptide deformylase [Deltaproteobacteria bacterium]
MPKKEIVIYPDKVLKSTAEKIENIDLDIINLAQDMTVTMYEAPGVGLAAPQVGHRKRLIVVDQTSGKEANNLIVIVNPEIVEKEGTETDSEMCLSVPDVSIDVPRAKRILVTGVDLEGNEVRIEAEGFLARIFQHEIDHLNGTVILDYASFLKRSIYLKKRKKGKI